MPDIETKTRTGKWCNFLIDRPLAAAMKAYRESQDPKPTETGLFSAAMREYLKTRGYWPPASDS